jgi:hypothetical protein
MPSNETGGSMNARDVLNWIENFARQIIVQDLSGSKRRKNRCILQFVPPGSTQAETVGGRSLEEAVCRAAVRMSQRKENAA